MIPMLNSIYLQTLRIHSHDTHLAIIHIFKHIVIS